MEQSWCIFIAAECNRNIFTEDYKGIIKVAIMKKARANIYPENMSREQRESLIRLNDVLCLWEKIIRHEALTIKENIASRIRDKSDWLQNYEVALCLFCFLGKDNPKYRDDGDNIICSYKYTLIDAHGEKGINVLCTGNNFNSRGIKDLIDTGRDEYHCFLYNALYEDAGIKWEDMLMIGRVAVDVVLTHQGNTEILLVN